VFDLLGGIAVGTDGRIYVTDVFENVVISIDDMSGTGYTYFGYIAKDSLFKQPTGLWVDGASPVYVASQNNDHLARFQDMQGVGYRSFGRTGTGFLQLHEPLDVVLAHIPRRPCTRRFDVPADFYAFTDLVIRSRRPCGALRRGLGPGTGAQASATAPAAAAPAPPGETAYPATVMAGTTTLIIYQPQIESFDGYQLTARAAVEAKEGDGTQTYGIIHPRARALASRAYETTSTPATTATSTRRLTAAGSSAWAGAGARPAAPTLRAISTERRAPVPRAPSARRTIGRPGRA